MTKMNYDPRYGNNIADGKYAYDDKVAAAMHKDNMRMAAVYHQMPQYKKDLQGYKVGQKVRKTTAKRNGTEPQDREEAEKRMAEAVAKVVETLEFHMEDMIQYRKFANHTQHVNQIGIHNAIVQLRTKCGVSFKDNTEYNHVIPYHPDPRTDEERRELYRVDMEQQRQARLRANREIAARLIARPKSG